MKLSAKSDSGDNMFLVLLGYAEKFKKEINDSIAFENNKLCIQAFFNMYWKPFSFKLHLQTVEISKILLLEQRYKDKNHNQ